VRTFTLPDPAALTGSLCFSLLQSQQSSLGCCPRPLPPKYSLLESFSAVEKQQERVAKGVWAQKAKDQVHALSRASFGISCPLHVKKGTAI